MKREVDGLEFDTFICRCGCEFSLIKYEGNTYWKVTHNINVPPRCPVCGELSFFEHKNGRYVG